MYAYPARHVAELVLWHCYSRRHGVSRQCPEGSCLGGRVYATLRRVLPTPCVEVGAVSGMVTGPGELQRLWGAACGTMLSQRWTPCSMISRNSGLSQRVLQRPLLQSTRTRSAATAPGSALSACCRMRLRQHLSQCATAMAMWPWSSSPGSPITRCRLWRPGQNHMRLR